MPLSKSPQSVVLVPSVTEIPANCEARRVDGWPHRMAISVTLVTWKRKFGGRKQGKHFNPQRNGDLRVIC